jgi:hypothetical protein
MNAVATGKNTFVVGGYVRESAMPAPYSAGGPVVKPGAAPRWPRRGPDAIAVSDQSRVLPGVLAAGTRSGSVVALNGTSVAAPQAARMKARELGRPQAAEAVVQNPKPLPGIERTGGARIDQSGGRRRARAGVR